MIYCIVICQLVFLIIKTTIYSNSLETKLFWGFNLLWTMLLILSVISPYGEYRISSDVLTLCLLFLLFFNIGYVILGGGGLKRKTFFSETNMLEQYDRHFLKNRKLHALLGLLTLILLLYSFRYQRMILEGNILDARIARYYVGVVFKSTIELLFYNFVVSASSFLLAFILSFSIVFGRMKNWVFFLALLDYILFSFVGAGRFPLVMLMIYVVVLLLVRNHYSEKRLTYGKIRIAFLTLIALIAIVFGMVYMTALRRGASDLNSNAFQESLTILWDQIIGYNTGPFSALSYMYDSGIMYNHMLFGKVALLNGIDEVISNICSFIGIQYSCSKYAIGEIANTQINFGTASFNALYTCMYWFFSDFGVLGVAIFSLFFGYVERISVSGFDKNPDVFSLMTMVHVVYFMFTAHMIWQINNVDSLLYLTLLHLTRKMFRKRL